ncbi:adenylate/guanylate cyclase domain-containing protein [Desulfolithobacter sp.]
MQSDILLLTAGGTDTGHFLEFLDGYAVTRCHDVRKAALLCEQKEIYLALVEAELDATSGIDWFGSIRVRHPHLSGLLIGNPADAGLLRRALDVGFSGIIETPVHGEQLRAQVERAMALVRLQEENTRLRTLVPLYSLGEQFLSSASEDEVLDSLLNVVEEQTGAVRISVMLFDEEESCLKIVACRGMDEELARSIRIRSGDQISGWVYARDRPVLLNREDQEESVFAPLLKRPDISTAISFPLKVRDRVLGVLNISRTGSGAPYTEADIEMLAVICSQAAMALDSVRASRIMAEKVRVRTLFEQYVAPEVAELLIASDSNLLDLGEIRDVTVLFADIRNFTGLVQHLDLTELRTFLNAFFQIFTDAIFQYRGTVDKFMGDAVLAIFGAPILLENASLNAIRTALAIKRRFGALRARWACRCSEFENVDLGIGITRGEMFLGNVGSSRRLDYTVIGSQVNIAQRLAAESTACQIYVTDSVRREIKQQVAVEQAGFIRLRGVDEEIGVYAVKGDPVAAR